MEGADGPMSAKSSREIPSGLRVDCPVGFLGCGWDGPAVEEDGNDRIERTSAAEAAIVCGQLQADFTGIPW